MTVNLNNRITSKVILIQIEGLEVDLVQILTSQVKLLKIYKCQKENRIFQLTSKLSPYMSGNTSSNTLVDREGTFIGIKKRDAIFAMKFQ